MRSDSPWSETSSTRNMHASTTSTRARLAESILSGLSIPLWVLDLAALRSLVASRAAEESLDARAVLHSAAVVSVNCAALAYHKTNCERELLKSLDRVFLPATIEGFSRALSKLRAGASTELDITFGCLDDSTVRARARFDLITAAPHAECVAMTLLPTPARSNLLEVMPDLAFEFDHNGVYVDFAGAADETFVPPHEFLGKSIVEVMPHEVAHRALAAIQRLRERGGKERMEYALTLSTGLRWYEALMAALPGGGAAAYVRDITEKKCAEWRLQESEKRYRTIAESAPVILWMTDRSDGCTFFNQTALEFSGNSRFEQERRSGWVATIHPDDAARCQALLEEHTKSQDSFSAEFRIRRHDGQYRWLLAQAVPRFSDGEFVGFIGASIDVTELKGPIDN